MEQVDFSGRRFKFWSFDVSHGMMLIRSPADEGRRQIDVMFDGVTYVACPLVLWSMSHPVVADPSEHGLSEMKSLFVRTTQLYSFETGHSGVMGLVTASHCMVRHSTLDLFELPWSWKS